jgi:hypothetical protein
MSTKPIIITSSQFVEFQSNTTYAIVGDNITLSFIGGSRDKISVTGDGDTVFFQGGVSDIKVQAASATHFDLSLLGPADNVRVSGWTLLDHATLYNETVPYKLRQQAHGTLLHGLPDASGGQHGSIFLGGARAYPWQIAESVTSPG